MKKLIKFTAIIAFIAGLCWSAIAWANKNDDKISAWLSGGDWYYYTVQSGDNIEKIFNKYSIIKNDKFKILSLKGVGDFLIKLQPGQEIAILEKSRKVISLYTKKNNKLLVINRKKNQFITKIESQQILKTIRHTSFVIDSNLYSAAKKYNISSNLISSVDKVLSGKIDFDRQLRKGDKLAITYEFLHSNSSDYYKLLDAKFCHKKQCFRALSYEKVSRLDFYDEKGYSLKRVFDRYPLRSFRISSTFARHRWHPVLHTWRSHLGVDLAAPLGAKIHATGDGRVVFSGFKGGYGRAVVIKHGKKYKTVYGHMSKIANKSWVGNFIKRGDVIGYVGKTGLATGYHCHYEFRINNKAVNPVLLKLPKDNKIKSSDRKSFANRKKYLDQWMSI